MELKKLEDDLIPNNLKNFNKLFLLFIYKDD